MTTQEPTDPVSPPAATPAPSAEHGPRRVGRPRAGRSKGAHTRLSATWTAVVVAVVVLIFLVIFIACLFMVPTVSLIWVTAKFEAFYTAYSKFLLGLSLSAPVCLSVLYLGEKHVGQGLINLCLYRLICLPFILAGMGISRLVARFDRAKRFASMRF